MKNKCNIDFVLDLVIDHIENKLDVELSDYGKQQIRCILKDNLYENSLVEYINQLEEEVAIKRQDTITHSCECANCCNSCCDEDEDEEDECESDTIFRINQIQEALNEDLLSVKNGRDIKILNYLNEICDILKGE